MSKYNRPPFFTSPYSNISPPATSFDMARSSSHDSTTSSAPSFSCAYTSLGGSQPMSRSSSTTSNYLPPTSAPTSAPMRRSSSSSSSQTTWLASPYRSCLTSTAEANSYLSDDDLLCLNIPVESIPNPSQPKRVADMTIEEQIAHLRNVQEQEEAQERQKREQCQRRKQVRFQPPTTEKPRRPAQLKRRSTTVKTGLSSLNGAQ